VLCVASTTASSDGLSAALERAVTYAHTLDPDACLKQLLAPQGVQPDGAAERWQFRFELPTARATPFPPPGSELGTGVAEGRLPCAGLSGVWREERRRAS
jgi:hypothetical protein